MNNNVPVLTRPYFDVPGMTSATEEMYESLVGISISLSGKNCNLPTGMIHILRKHVRIIKIEYLTHHKT